MELSDYEQRIGKSRYIEVKIVCENCGIEKWVRWTRVKVGQGRFCGRTCANVFRELGDKRKYVGKENGKMAFDVNKQNYYVYWFDPDTLKRKTTTYARWWWEINKGEVPDGYRVSYGDGNELNIDPDNIVLVSPQEFGQEISLRLMGHSFSDETLQKMSDAKAGKSLSDEHKLKIGNASRDAWANGKFDGVHKGEHNYKWRGGVEKSYPKEFNDELKRIIKERDKYKCQICKTDLYKTHKAQIHHIDGNRSNNSLDNLILLCSSCHHSVHTPSNKDEIILAFRSKLWK